MVTCRDILNHNMGGVNLIAGEAGLNRMVSWVYLVQTKPYKDHMNQGDLALIVVDYNRISDGNGVPPYVWGEADLAVGGVRVLDPSYAGKMTVLPKAKGVLLEVED